MTDQTIVVKEPIETESNPAGTGRPIISEEQYKLWLDDMAPFLKQGASINYSLEKAGLISHQTAIYEKYRVGDWFSQKVDRYRAYVGELINMVGFKTIQAIHNRMVESDGKVGINSSEDLQVWKTMAEKHRTSQPFFVTRVETAQANEKSIGKILDVIESEAKDYEQVAQEAQKQVEALNPPVQDQEQAGADSDVQAESTPTQAPSGEGQP